MVGVRKRAQVNYAEDAGYVDRASAHAWAPRAAPCAWDACLGSTGCCLRPAGPSWTRMKRLSAERSGERRR